MKAGLVPAVLDSNFLSKIKLITGLGNPGKEYQDHRHNVGFWLVDLLSQDCQSGFKFESKFQSEVAKVSVGGNNVWLLKPQTFMNLSGQALHKFTQYYQIELDNVLVVHDELDLPVGSIKLKKGGGAGGHNGLKDIIAHQGKEFMRLRIGIGHPGDRNKVSGFVLSNPGKKERELIGDAIHDALREMGNIVDGKMNLAMQSLHSRATGEE